VRKKDSKNLPGTEKTCPHQKTQKTCPEGVHIVHIDPGIGRASRR
jgi:hypothetical protein